MLDAFIIDRMKRQKQEEAERSVERERPVLEIPIPVPDAPWQQPREEREEETPPRGVIVIDL